MKAKISLGLWVGIVTFLSLMPTGNNKIHFFKHEDKVVHAIFYLVMCYLLLLFFRKMSWQNHSKYAIALACSISYGILMELLQNAMNYGRHFDSFDIIANIIGALIGMMFFINSKRFLS